MRFDEAQWSSGSTARGLAVVGRLGHRDEIEEGPPHSSGTPALRQPWNSRGRQHSCCKLLVKPRTTLNTAPASGQGPRNSGATSALKRGFLTNVLNPKVGVFYATFLPQFIPHGVNIAAFSLLLAGIHVLLTLAWFSLLVAITIPLGQFLAKQRVVKTLDRLTGCVFVAFGVKLAVARRA